MSVHIYRAPWQPLTRYFDTNLPGWFQNKRRSIGVCQECRRRRWRKNLKIMVFYDYALVRCKDTAECEEVQTWAMSKR